MTQHSNQYNPNQEMQIGEQLAQAPQPQQEAPYVKPKVALTTTGLLNDITKEGLSREEIAKKYNLPVSQIRKAIKEAGLKQKKAAKVMYTLTDDTIV